MVTYLDDRMVNTCNGWADAETSQTNGSNPPSPPILAQVIASILESHDEQTELLRQRMANSARGGNGKRNATAPTLTTHSDFVVTHLPLFTEAVEPLEADHWLRVIEFKFRLLRCMRCRRLSSSRSNCVVMPARGGPTTPPLTPRTTRRRGLSSTAFFTPTTS
jgi:hypothetical protein